MKYKFRLVESDRIWKNKRAIDGIDCSFLLAHVFGKPIRGEQAFMYFFRRYGPPKDLFDDYKELCSYSFRTNVRDIIVTWPIRTGAHHHGLYAFADSRDWWKYMYGPTNEVHKQLEALAQKDGGVYFGGNGLFSMYLALKNGKTKFMGNEIQRRRIDEFLAKYSEDDSERAWDDLHNWMKENDKLVREKYGIPMPVAESIYNQPFYGRFDDPVEAGKLQHEWIVSLPEDHFLRRVYFAAMALFEDWRRPTYIRDVYFNLTCDSADDFHGRLAEYAEWQEE